MTTTIELENNEPFEVKQYTLDEVDEVMDDVIGFSDPILWEDYDTHQIWLDGPCIRIPELEIDIYSGVYCYYDEEENEYIGDFTIYVFMEMETMEYLYDEGYTSIEAAIHNYAHRNGITCDVYALKCEIPNQFS